MGIAVLLSAYHWLVDALHDSLKEGVLEILIVVVAFVLLLIGRSSPKRKTPHARLRRTLTQRSRRKKVQDRYAGDVGDFGKFGLLRWLCRKDAHGEALNLGVLWYKFNEEDKNDGGHVRYLYNPTGQQKLLERCDRDLYRKLRAVVDECRSIAKVEAEGVLPVGTVTHSDGLSFDGVQLAERDAERSTWLNEGLRKVKDADIVFFDPDNGMEVRSCSKRSKYAPKYVFCDDLVQCWKRGQSIVVYQHFGRSTAEAEAGRRYDSLVSRLKGVSPLVLRYRRGTARAFFVLAQPEHSNVLANRVESFLESPWGLGNPPHFERFI